jgi:monoamine oxidase
MDNREEVARRALASAREGLGRSAVAAKRVVVIGAGMAGLAAALELKRHGHEVVVLEGQNRVGGRVHTLRRFAPGLSAEAGAMRIPRAHALVLEYCRRFGLELQPFVMANPRTLVCIGDCRMTAEAADADPSLLPFEVDEHERGRSATALWEAAIVDVRAELDAGGPQAWDSIAARLDQYSIYEFLRARGFSEAAVEMFAILNFVEADLNTAVMEFLREDLGGAYVDMQYICGGMDRLPLALYEDLKDEVRFGAEVVAIDQDAASVTVHYRTIAGHYSVTGDRAVCTLPFPVLRNVEVLTPFSHEKQKAIRQLNYHDSTKILFQVRRRFWEQDDGIVGGSTVTDLPVRRIVYPSPDPARDQERAVLLASYTWGQDASRWGAMDEETRIEQALEDVARIHPAVTAEFEVGASHSWGDDPWARGAFVLFNPEQQTQLPHHIAAVEGRVHFAGEHCSLWHAWIEGALESALRAAREVHEAP